MLGFPPYFRLPLAVCSTIKLMPIGRIPPVFSRLLAWLFLSAGIALGSYWAYYELGWGGFWFWDPVENASLNAMVACHRFVSFIIGGAEIGKPETLDCVFKHYEFWTIADWHIFSALWHFNIGAFFRERPRTWSIHSHHCWRDANSWFSCCMACVVMP